MGILKNSLIRLENNGAFKKGTRVLELGCQNIYHDVPEYGIKQGMVSRDYFKSIGVDHVSVDILGCQNANQVDLRQPNVFSEYGEFDIITDFGTLEHVVSIEGLYEAFKNVHNACTLGGIMIHEVPMTGNWPNHELCEWWFSEESFMYLYKKNNYQLVELTKDAAMGNTKDGWLVVSVLRKINYDNFMTLEEFKDMPIFKS